MFLPLLPSLLCFPTLVYRPHGLHSFALTSQPPCTAIYFFSSFFFFCFKNLSYSLRSLAPFSSCDRLLLPFISLNVGKKPSRLFYQCSMFWVENRKGEWGGKAWERGKVKGEGRRWLWNDSLDNVRILFALLCFGWWGIQVDLQRLWAGILWFKGTPWHFILWFVASRLSFDPSGFSLTACSDSFIPQQKKGQKFMQYLLLQLL